MNQAAYRTSPGEGIDAPEDVFFPATCDACKGIVRDADEMRTHRCARRVDRMDDCRRPKESE